MLKEIKQLQRDRQAWEAILELMPDPALLIDKNYTIIATNSRFLHLSHYEPTELYTTVLDDLFNQNSGAMRREKNCIECLVENLNNDNTQTLELAIQPKQGDAVQVLLSLKQIQDNDLLGNGFIVSLKDIQSLHGVQSRLEDEKQRYESLFNSISDAVFLAPLSKEGVHGNFVEVNDVACQRLGYSRNELLHMNARSINPGFNIEKVKAFGRRIRREKEIQFDAIHVGKDGTQIPVGVTANLVNIAEQEFLLSVARDLREIKQREKSEERFGRLLDHSWNEIFIFQVDTYNIVQANDGALDNLGFNSSEILERSYDQLLQGSSREYLSEKLEPLVEGASSVVIFEALHKRKDGSEYPVEVRAQMSHSEVPAVFLVNAHDISERKKAEERLHFLANYDSLTSLPNRSLMMDRLGQAIENAKRSQMTCALIFMDLDGFKEINDTLGHDAGDNLLKVVAIRLQEILRKSDTIARLGGDEFTILLCNLSSARDVDRVAQKVIEEIAKPIILNGASVQVTTSLGVVIFPNADDDVSSLLRKSDSAMYIAKKTGKNKWCMYNETTSA